MEFTVPISCPVARRMDMPLRLDKAGEVDIEAVVFHPYFMRWGASCQWRSLFRAFYHHSVGSRLQGRGQEQGTVLIVTDKRAYNPHFFLVLLRAH